MNKGPFKHGGFLGRKATPEYRTWLAMRARCLYPMSPHYTNWGGRGITICERWMQFANFRADMGTRPLGTQIDRINNDLGYSPDNCRWVSQAENLRNRRNCRYVFVSGERMTLAEAIRVLGLNEHTVRARVRRGCDAQQALR